MLSVENVPAREQERLQPHWDQFVNLLRGGRGEVQAEKLPVLESIAEKVREREEAYAERIEEQEQYIEALEDGNVTMYGLEPHPKRIEMRLESAKEKLSEWREAKSFLTDRRLAAKKVYRRFVIWGKLPVKWNDLPESTKESIKEESEPPIGGYYGPRYALKAKEILEEDASITRFSDLEREMTESKVDTVKRNIGYNDLPREEKAFSRFEELLTEKVRQLRGEG